MFSTYVVNDINEVGGACNTNAKRIKIYARRWKVAHEVAKGRQRIIQTWSKVKLSLCVIDVTLHHGDVWGSGCTDPCFLTSALVRGEFRALVPGGFNLRGKKPRCTHFIGWVGPLPVWMTWNRRNSWIELRSLCRPARSQSLYRLIENYSNSYNCRGNVFTDHLPSNNWELTHTQKLMGGIYQVRRWDRLRCRDIHKVK
jgi:hypothetical protein